MRDVKVNEDTIIKNAFSWWKISLAIFFGISVASWMLYRSLANQHFSDIFSEINWSTNSWFWLFAAIICMVGRDYFYMLRIKILTKNQLSWKKSFHVIMLWEFASALAPGVMSGATVAMFILNREKIPMGRATAIIIITALMDNLFYVLLIPFVFLFINQEFLFPNDLQGSSSVQWVFWIGFTIKVILCAFLFSSIFLVPKLTSNFISGLFKIPFLKRWQSKAIKTSEEIEISSEELKNEPKIFWIKALFATFASWTCRYLVINCILNAFINLSLINNIQILGKQLVLWLLMMVSPTPGGSGVAEFAFGELLAPFSNSLLLITFLAILWRLISYFPYLFIGAIILPKWLKK